MSKVLFIDVDGTLVDYEGNLPPSAVEAIRKARAEVYQNIWDIMPSSPMSQMFW